MVLPRTVHGSAVDGPWTVTDVHYGYVTCRDLFTSWDIFYAVPRPALPRITMAT